MIPAGWCKPPHLKCKLTMARTTFPRMHPQQKEWKGWTPHNSDMSLPNFYKWNVAWKYSTWKYSTINSNLSNFEKILDILYVQLRVDRFYLVLIFRLVTKKNTKFTTLNLGVIRSSSEHQISIRHLLDDKITWKILLYFHF